MLKMPTTYIAFWGMLCLTAGVLAERTNSSARKLFNQSDYKFDFGRIELIRYNKIALKTAAVVTFKYNRTCPAVNISLDFNIEVGNELEIIVQAYKFLSNEYRLFPMRYQVNFCDAIKTNIAGVTRLIKCGNFSGCPFRKGRIHTCNFTPDASKFPPFFPNGKYLLELQGLYRSTEIFVLHGDGEVYRPIKRV